METKLWPIGPLVETPEKSTIYEIELEVTEDSESKPPIVDDSEEAY